MKWTYEEIIIQCNILKQRALSKKLKPKRFYISENMVDILEEANNEFMQNNGFFMDIKPYTMLGCLLTETKSENIIDLISE